MPEGFNQPTLFDDMRAAEYMKVEHVANDMFTQYGWRCSLGYFNLLFWSYLR
jgi:hypothetical protein